MSNAKFITVPGEGSLLSALASKLTVGALAARNADAGLYRATDYGVAADGVTNCAPALQSLVDLLGALDQISTIYMPAGIYAIQSATITVPRNVYILGAGGGDCPLECFKGRQKDMRGTILLFKGTGPRVLTQIGVTADGLGGGAFTNTNAKNANDAVYSLTNFYNNNANRMTGAAATPKPFSACVRVDGGGREGAHLVGLRIMLSFDGSATTFGYVNNYAYVGGYTYMPPENLGQADYDVGLYADNTLNAVFEEIYCLGYFRIAGVYRSMYKHQLIQTDPLAATTDNDNGGERTRFYRCKTMGQVGYLSRAGDTWPVIGRTSNTLDLPWADYHPFDPVLLGQRLRVVSNGTSATINFTGTQFVPAAGGKPDLLRLTGVTPDPTLGNLATQLDPDNYAAISPVAGTFAASGSIWRDSDIFDMNHATQKRVTDLSGVTARPSACFEISGVSLSDERFDHCHLRGIDDVLFHLHNCFSVAIDGSTTVESYPTIDGITAGKRMIASPNPRDNARVPYPRGITTRFRWDGGISGSFIDTAPMYPTIIGSRRPSKYTDAGFFEPASCSIPEAAMSPLSYGTALRRAGKGGVGLADIKNTLLLYISDDDQSLAYRTDAGDGLGYVNRFEYIPGAGFDLFRIVTNQFAVAPRAPNSGSADRGPTTFYCTYGRTQFSGLAGKVLVDIQDNNIRFNNVKYAAGTGELLGSELVAQITADAILAGKPFVPASGFAGLIDIGSTLNPFRDVYVTSVRFGAGPRLLSGTGAPEGVAAGAIGSVFSRSDGGTGSALYIKEAGLATDKTGWRAVPTKSPLLAGWPSGTVIQNANITTAAAAAVSAGGAMIFVPILVPAAATATQIGPVLATAQAGGECRLAIYADNGSTPSGGALIVDAGVVDLSSGSGFKFATISQALPAGLVWACIQIKALATQVSLWRVTAGTGQFVFGSTTNFATGLPPRYYASTGYTYGTMPAVAPSAAASSGGDGVLIGVRN